MDVNAGKILEHLKKTGEYDNTFIVFMSDNGAEGAAMEAARKCYFDMRKKVVSGSDMWTIHSSAESVGWELFADAALRKGEWKVVHISRQRGGVGEGDEGWELFNVVEDPGETKDLAEADPGKLQEPLDCWDEYVVECGIIWSERALAPGLDKDEAPEFWEDQIELQKVWMGAKAGQTQTAV